ncbi:hypothetical protein [Vreelandella salicampi]|uniref:Uncharacterized protein n=1 Tax=Vreelandella salicampi TaxID=1449798 RepID=A0A7Z0RVR2_9GAMM|nr:hypothetical protein [Halomonas salicampi]NYS61450.1 hypothetical protein [Halomonas salicampi]
MKNNIKQWLKIDPFMLMRNFQRLAIMLTRMRIFLASLTKKNGVFPFFISRLGAFGKVGLLRKTRMRMNKTVNGIMKSTHAAIAVLASLAVSVGLNAFLFWQNTKWEEAFFKQVGTVAQVEMLFKASDADTSYSNMLTLSRDLFGSSVSEAEADSIHLQFGADQSAIQLVDAKLLFKDGEFYGTKVYLPGH